MKDSLFIQGYFVSSVVDCSASGGNPCMNGGTCENNACTCAAGFNGALCSTGEKIIITTLHIL